MSLKDIAGPIVQGVFGLGGGALASRSQDKATKSRERANAQALAYQREQDVARREDYKQAMAVWDANRRALLSRYGVNLGGAPMGQPGPMVQPGGQMAGPAAPGVMGGQPMGGRPTNLREILMAKGGGMPDAMGGWRRSSSY